MPMLFEPLSLRSLKLRNRIGVSPMCQYSSVDGAATDWHLVHLGARAAGGAGLVIAEATAVEAIGRITPGDAGLWDEKHIEPLAKVVKFIKSCGSIAGIQLAHAGRKASAARPWDGGAHLERDQGGWMPVAPSPLAFGGALNITPREATIEDIKRIQQCFVSATERALRAGFEFIELHAAHGYLAYSFLSPLSNKRSDQYGGSFENRTRFVRETATLMREKIPDRLPLAVRLSCSDWVEGGWSIDESVALAKVLRDIGVELIDCSSGGGTPDRSVYPAGPGWQTPFAQRIRSEAEIHTAAVGIITSAVQAEHILRTKQADLVLLGREMLRDPYWAFHAARELGANAQDLLPQQYGYAV